MITVCEECPHWNNGAPAHEGQYFGRCSTAVSKRIYRGRDEGICSMFKKTTMEPWLWPLMKGKTLKASRCAVCGKTSPLNQHHIVRRGDGELFGNDGRALPKPTITLCGSGTQGCHGLAHELILHFRWNDGWEYLKTEEPVQRIDALQMSGWVHIDIPLHQPETVEIQTRCTECKWVLTMGGLLSCGHPDLSVEPDWMQSEAEPYLPVEADGFCSRGEWCG